MAYWFKGDVPDRNLKEMEGFVLRHEDKNRPFLHEYITDGIKYKGYYKTDTIGRKEFTQVDISTEEIIEDIPFSICAPISDFDDYYVKNYVRVKDGYKLISFPDPIVLQPVKGGYLIVTKWGLEASDESVVNEKMN